jgi:hypothetical protein
LQIKKTKIQKKEKTMQLKDYVEDACIHYAKAAKRLDISISQYYAILRDEVDIPLSLIVKIEEFTKGKVKYKDWLEAYHQHAHADKNKNKDNDDACLNHTIRLDNSL